MLVEETIIFSRKYTDFGEITIRPFQVVEDSIFLQKWVTKDYAVFWGMENATLQEVQEEYAKLLEPEGYDVFVGMFHNEPAFVLERYNPQKDLINNFYDSKISDIGIHIIVAPPRKEKIPNFTWFMFRSIMDFVFENPKIERILVEPDIRNKKMFALCERIGFQLSKVIELPHKTAQLAFLIKTNYNEKMKFSSFLKRNTMNTLDNIVSPQQSIQHIQPEIWKKANILLVKKALCEFSHELLITPRVVKELERGYRFYSIQADDKNIYYEFKAKPLALNHLLIEENSIKKFVDEKLDEVDAIYFIKEFQKKLGITNEKMPVYLEEIISTLHGSVFKIFKGNPIVKELASADFQTIEQSMTEGHPGFVANNGRIGFDSSDYRSYAPEAGNSFSLLWLAGHKSRTTFSAIEALPYEKLIREELDAVTIQEFNSLLVEKGLDPEEYLFLPIHPWQWFNKLATIFASEIAKGNLVCLGYGADQYLAQQSIRTLFNITNRKKFYTKSALSILNMGFMRGLPLYYLGTAPKMAVWLENLLYNDPYIKKNGFRMLSEIGSVSYVNPYFEEFGVHNDYNKMLASLWRESPYSVVKENEKPLTMAALLHIDHHGNALLPEIIKDSGISIDHWLRKYLNAYLSPLLHCFYYYDLVFMPHGENIIMVFEDNAPEYILLKDITEEACILNKEVELPEDLKRMYASVPEDVKLLSIFTDIFDGFFRFLTAILEEHMSYDAEHFWKLVAENIHAYQSQFPKLAKKFEQYDLFAADFKLSCLNRLQLNNHKQMIDLDDPVALLQFVGKLKNPIEVFKKKEI
ncbi:GNAT family N-acetyltransferase [Tenacibaculum maritimum]|uniref:GNAT family N-acetyltransferase n=1 Tax=Tenacibaculum maritimum TaxID=107401 RepID=UPI0012E4B6E2|nr:GNAT family N-acetyltransferase [Tenacibaculum maritimum]MCD9582249.1 GNAT family N-acetyltransferase [Tenacibaculum maritimum]MCD9634597.1 GNAT family N-acetyltransferase [Tenacibaculum maritimum]CAA0216005.1 Siderophore biosynthesis protein TbsCD [Tenacibaculum maritimum]CAA0234542.1 Siderophore biosynthesis protein TbsCD [Tenacibaculum maritimum]